MLELIIVTKKYGSNFTGATIATQYFIEQWANYFDNIVVLTNELGNFNSEIKNLRIVKCDNEKQILSALKDISEKKDIQILGYSDDHLGYLMSKYSIPYIHTYHGNWPDAKFINLEFFLKSYYFIPLYKKTIEHAKIVVNVSEYMETFTKKKNPNSVVIRNGMACSDVKCENSLPLTPAQKNTFVMVGNVDSRKYKKAITLARIIHSLDSEIKIDIYGKSNKKIGKILGRIENINLKGQCSNIPYSSYCGLINTSKIENLSISVCEAIKAGIPVFCFKIGGLPEVVKENETGFVFEKNEIRQMAESIVSYSKQDIKMDVVKDYIKDFDWNSAAEKYLTLFRCLKERVL